MKDLISIIITSYNSNELYLEEAILSVLNQSYKNKEIILVDDGSKNGVAYKLCVKYKQIKYIFQENHGLASARNTGIKNSHGEYICFLDDDDTWDSDKVFKQVEYFNKMYMKDKYIGLVFTFQNDIDEDGKLIGKTLKKANGNVFDKMLYGNVIGAPSSVMIKKSILNDIGYFNQDYRYAEDIELWYRLTKRYSVYSLEEYLLNYRIRKNSLSKNIEKMNLYCEKAFLAMINNEVSESSIDEIRSKRIISNYYLKIEMTRSFANNKSTLSKKSYIKAVGYRPIIIFNIKYLLKYIMCFFGDNFLEFYNKNIKNVLLYLKKVLKSNKSNY